jgi:predicted neuraminidase
MAPATLAQIAYRNFGLSGQIAYGNLAKDSDGRVFCALALKSKERWDSIYISSTSDAGKTWTDAGKVMDIAGQPGYIADPNVLTSSDGVRVFATYVPMKDGRFSRSEFLASHSTDGVHNWSDPKPLDLPYRYKSGKVHVPIWLDNTTVAMPFCWDVPAQENRAEKAEGQMFGRAGVLISKDNGRTWKAGGDIAVDIRPMGADETAVVRLKNGDIFAVARTFGEHPYETLSHDGGQTWDEPTPSKLFGHNSPSALLRLSDGRIVRAWDNSPKTRVPLVVSVSSDECKTWSSPKTIIDQSRDAAGTESLSQASYPSIAQAGDGTVLIVWTETNQGKSRVGTVRFSPDWLTSDSKLP